MLLFGLGTKALASFEDEAEQSFGRDLSVNVTDTGDCTPLIGKHMTGKATRQTKRAATAKCKPLKRKAAKTPLANAKGLIIKMSEHLPGDILLFHSNVQKALAKQISKATGSPYFDGTMHMKSFGHKHVSKKLQPLTGAFKGTEHLGSQMGHGPKGVGAICDPADFSEVVEVAPGILGPRDGSVVVDLVEPNCEPLDCLNVVQKEVFRDTVPWIVIRVCS